MEILFSFQSFLGKHLIYGIKSTLLLTVPSTQSSKRMILHKKLNVSMNQYCSQINNFIVFHNKTKDTAKIVIFCIFSKMTHNYPVHLDGLSLDVVICIIQSVFKRRFMAHQRCAKIFQAKSQRFFQQIYEIYGLVVTNFRFKEC